MKKTKKAEDTMLVGKFELVNTLKVERAMNAVGRDEQAILVEYDKLGGFIRYEGNKVINGAFYDRKTGKAVVDPKPRIIKKQKAIIEEEIEEVSVDEEESRPKARRGRKEETVEEEIAE